MSDPFIGEIKAVGFDYAPQGWAKCYGQLVSVAQNQALFALLGDRYGGDGTTNFALPDLRGRVPIGDGNAPGLFPKYLGHYGGVEAEFLSTNQLPKHSHQATLQGKATGTVHASTTPGTEQSPDGSVPAVAQTAGSRPDPIHAYTNSSDTSMATNGVDVDISKVQVAVEETGNNDPINVMQPYLVINYIIALTGLFPPRS